MKKIFGLAIVCVSLGLWSCTGSSKPTNETTTDAPVIADTHTAKNSLDYKGTYKGALPCADCDSIAVSLTLGDSDYTKTDTYHKNGKTSSFESKGTYSWDANGNIISLDGTDAPNKYFVGENYLTQLDINGNEITGDFAAMYVLKK